MKKLIYISLIILSPLVIFGQEKAHSSKEKDEKTIFQAEGTKQASLKEQSKEQTSVSDSSNSSNKTRRGERMQKMRKKMMDSFMDKDGDGINDCRAKGMGWSQGKGKHKGFGRHGK